MLTNDLDVAKSLQGAVAICSAASGFAVNRILSARQNALPALDATLLFLDDALHNDWADYERLATKIVDKIVDGGLK